MRQGFDIFVSGGGIAGLSAAAAFGSAGFSVMVVDPSPPATCCTYPAADHRSTVFLQPARNTLSCAGIWDKLAPFAAPLQIMRIADAGGEASVIRKVADFNAAEISDQPFGWNLPNWLLRREMTARLAELGNVNFRPGVGTGRITQRTGEVLVSLTDGTQIATPLVVAADGRNSFVRDSLGIAVTRWTYGQQAMAFTVRHAGPGNDISTEIHRTGGPFTLVPLPDGPDGPESAVVWMERTARAEVLMAMDADEFSAAASERSCNLHGPLHLSSPRSIWPVISMQAKALTDERVALISEAAHVVPPIGAQGLNMSLADIETLLSLARKSPQAPGSRQMLATYAKRRQPDITARLHGVDMLNRVAMANSRSLRDLRLKGLGYLHGLTAMRRVAMRTGLGG
ncbi:MAG: UbiH/UbiF family hydroxylase [Rhodobacteraceae bacterium]|nr:UbiH/UbiF family hydroxylase [Paracoccaceae bacterium]